VWARREVRWGVTYEGLKSYNYYMNKNPFLNAFAATAYISLVASIMFYAPKGIDNVPSVLVPIAMISLFTLSAAVMGYLFIYTPLALYLDGQKKEAVRLFLSSVATFAIITACIFGIILSEVLS
jgi:hypothetical protein